ncbi:hypothetical protein EYZ11_000745 [Aspergillus tanneri]|uniref:Uncharacterized protein n=1 Tax=Aspergillus tanneri TaxID=1220188 RepID=A0A4S3JWH8_9EURO|nr:hypothetical protein EYZ11_000745 [Aspergillus tanneri]
MATLPLQLKCKSNTANDVFNILGDFVQPTSSTTPAAIAESIDRLKPSLPGNDLESFLWETWVVFITVAEQIPHDHCSQDRLVEVIDALTQLPSTTVQIWGSDICVWKDLPLLGATMRESWRGPTPDNSYAVQEDAEKCVNLNSFAARLLKLDSISWFNFAIWTLRSALEQNPPEAELGTYVNAAAEWIKYSGKVLFDMAEASGGENEDRILSAGALYLGPSKLCLERWAFWKQRLNRISEVPGQIGYTSEEAKRIMDEIDSLG